MKKSKKIAVLFVCASVLASTSTIFAATASKSTGITKDEFVPSKENSVDANNFVKTAAGNASFNTDFTKAAESTINSVVSIKSYETPKQQQQIFQGGDGFDPFEFFFGPGFGSNNNNNNSQKKQQQQKSQEEAKPQPSGLGSGVIISEDGYIVTNNHVVDGAEKLEVTLNDNRQFNARVIGTDPNSDIALLKISATGLQPIVFGNSDAVKVGEWVLAVGNPFGFTSTVTAGIISAKARGLNVGGNSGKSLGIEAFIQTDAAINPGNSGGALVNTNGELIGINTLIYSNTGNYAGNGFAIPSSVVKKIVTDLKQYGTVQRAVLGIKFEELDANKAKEHNITTTNEGIYVAKVTDRSAAMEAGIKEGDVIVKLNGHDIKNGAQMLEQMNKLRPGDKAEITYYRENKLKTTEVTLKNDQGTTKVTKSIDMMSLGCAFQELTSQEKKDLSITTGIKVVGVKAGKFKTAGIKDGFVITDINNSPVSTREDVENIYGQIMRDTDSDKVMFITGLYPTGKKVYYAVDLTDN
jgi:serine protease Do